MDYATEQPPLTSNEQTTAHWSEHTYPHSHHGTPAQEYVGFTWPPAPSIIADVTHSQLQQSLQPLVMPQWPSMLTSQTATRSSPIDQRPPLPSHVASMPQVPTYMTEKIVPNMAKPGIPGGRRTLTDEDRRKMCVFAEQHPLYKQTEIGAAFGVDRSTVSKVLRQKDKWLPRDLPIVRPAIKRERARTAEVERGLIAWVRTQQSRGVKFSDDDIRTKATVFANTFGGEVSNPAKNTKWLEKFKRKHCSGASQQGPIKEDQDVKSEPASEMKVSPDPESMDLSLDTNLSNLKSEDEPTFSSPESLSRFTTSPLSQQSQSSGAVSATDYSSTGFIPAGFADSANYLIPAPVRSNTSLSTSKKSMPPPSQALEYPYYDLPRRQTLPNLGHTTHQIGSQDDITARFATSAVLESPMEDYSDMISTPAEDETDLLETSIPPKSSSLSHLRFKTNGKQISHGAGVSEIPTSSSSIEHIFANSTISQFGKGSESPPDQIEASKALDKVVRYFSGRNDLANDELIMIGQLRQKLKS